MVQSSSHEQKGNKQKQEAEPGAVQTQVPEKTKLRNHKQTIEQIEKLLAGDKRKLNRASVDRLIKDLVQIREEVLKMYEENASSTNFISSVEGFDETTTCASDALTDAWRLFKNQGLPANQSTKFNKLINQSRSHLKKTLKLYKPELDKP